MVWNQKPVLRVWLLSGMLFFACLGEGLACSIPVFRYALDRWEGKSSPDNAASHALYEEIVDRILSGDSAVFVQIDGSDAEKNGACFEHLASRLKFFQSVAELPIIDPNDPSSQLGPGPELELRFSTIRISQTDPAVSELAGPKLAELPKDEPWVIPVFGRGRVLGAWSESLMDAEGIDEICHYLTGACSCQVKQQNPGWDLTMNVDWEARLWAAQEENDQTPEPDPVPDEPTLSTDEPTEVVYGKEPSRNRLLPFLGAAILLIGGYFLLRRK
jgi:hypothetical protein